MATTKRRSEPSTELEGTKKKFKSGYVFSWHISGCTGRVEQYYLSSKISLLANENSIFFQPCSTVKLASVSYGHETLPAWDVHTMTGKVSFSFHTDKHSVFIQYRFQAIFMLTSCELEAFL